MALADFSSGVQDALAQLIRDRLEQEEVQRQVEQQKFQNQRALNTEGFRDRSLTEDTRRFNASHALDQDKFGLDREGFDFTKQTYADAAPMRAATLDHTKAQTTDLLGRPIEAQKDRDHDVSMANLNGTWGIRTIGAQGAQQRMTQSHGASLAAGPSTYSQERNVRNLQSVEELKGKINNWTAGAGSLLANVPATDARNFAAELDTLKANIAFGELTAMREASKTGGALGQVSNIELGLLQSALGALDPGQSPENLKAQLDKVAASIRRWEEASMGASGGGSRGAGAGPGPSGPQVGERRTINGQLGEWDGRGWKPVGGGD